MQRTRSSGNPASAHSASRYGVYEVEMMKAGIRALHRVEHLERLGHEQHALGAEELARPRR